MAETTIVLPPQIGFATRFWRKLALLRESKVGMIGAALVGFWVFCAIFAPVLAPFDPNNDLFTPSHAEPGAEIYVDGDAYVRGELATESCELVEEGEQAGRYHCGTVWLGTDKNGRDILSRILYGAQRVLIYAPIATLCAYLVGIPMGLLAGYLRGRVDDILSFVANVILSFPVMVLYVLIIATMPKGGFTVIAAVVFASSPGVFRIVRGLTLDLRTREYVYAAETRGESLWYIILVEILPNARGPLIVDAMLRLGYVTITIGTLGFLGLGLPPPDPDWGQMIASGREALQEHPNVALFPCLAISSLVLGFNLLADGLREISLRD
jgi:peptide/nickel transport system permease protein